MGANLYCTPPGGAQGLSRHVDDHDVLVMQLEGIKRWRIWAPHDGRLASREGSGEESDGGRGGGSGGGGGGGRGGEGSGDGGGGGGGGNIAELPRLYAPRPAPAPGDAAPWRCVILRPGAWLYLPRGWGHEA